MDSIVQIGPLAMATDRPLVNQAVDAAAIREILTAEGLAGDAVLTDPGGLLGQAIASPALPERFPAPR